MKLNRRFSPLHLLILSINGMVGSAWLFAPLYAAKIAGPWSIISWILGGIITALIALTFAELSVMFPVAGGTAQIPQISHGTLTSFILGWVAWLANLAMAPVEVLAVLQYASTYFPSLMQSNAGVDVLTPWGLIWASILMLMLCIINMVSFKGLLRFNFVLFFFKVAIIVLVIFCFVKTNFHVRNFIPHDRELSIYAWKDILSALATGGIAFAFAGFKHGVELAGEAKELKVAIPLATVGSVLCCLLLYLGLQLAFIGILEPEMLAHGWQQLNFIGDAGPFAGLAAALGLFWLLKLLYIDAAISPLGAGLVYVTSTARIIYAMAQLGFVPKFLGNLSKNGFPSAAIGLNFVLGMFLFLPLPGWQAMVSFLVSGMVISYAMGPIALLCLRLELPVHKRQFRLPAAELLCLFAFYFCNLISYWTGWPTIHKLALAIIIGFIFFIGACISGRLKEHYWGLKSLLWLVPYFLGLFVISYLGAFGGKNIIPFGWDFLVIGIFSVIILYLAVLSRASIIANPNYPT